MFGEMMVCGYISIASMCLQMCHMDVCNLGSAGRGLTEVHCV